VRRLHAYAQGGYSGDAGSWKKRDNEIIEIRPNGERRVRFTPTPARDTPRAVTILCRNYQELCVLERIPILLTTATFVFDFLCIHPFRDGNGRVSRLLTTLLLQSNGFDVARYISLERQVEERKEEYYNALEECSARWNEGKNSIIPWWNYFLGVVRAAYREFEKQIELAGKRPVKTEMIRQIVLDQAGEFTLSDIAGQVPAASPQLIKKVLSELKAKHGIRLRGRGRGAAWEVIPRRTTARAR
jgi:Fic family protein